MADDTLWRVYVNSLPELDEEGDDAPQMEKIPKKKPAGRKFFVQKIVTEVYVYTDLEAQGFSDATFQELTILGEMSEAKLKKLLGAQARKRNNGVDSE